MSDNRIRILLLAALIVGLIWYFWPKFNSIINSDAALKDKTTTSETDPKTKTLSNSQSQSGLLEAAETINSLPKSQDAINAFKQALSIPFTCWGKVVDENNNPVIGASVLWSANNNSDVYGSGSSGQTTSDSNGMFSVSSTGIGLYVKVTKNGYYSFLSNARKKIVGSDRGFSTGGRLGNTDTPMGTKENPAIFVLRKMGDTASLLKKEGGGNVAKNGTPVAIDLKSGRISSKGEVTIACWVQDQGVDTTVYNVYDWHCVISISGGGLIERQDAYEFIAPIEGYSQSDEVQMPKSEKRWKPQVTKEYFAKLSDGTYARIQVKIITGADNFIRFESYLNPVPGDRNLEYDPVKEIQVK